MIINLLVILFTFAGCKSILFSKNGLEKSLQWITCAFILGYRTFEPFQGLKMHPIEIFVYVTIIRIIIIRPHQFMRIPASILVLGMFFVTVFIIDSMTRYNQWAILEFKNSFLILLIFLIARYIHFSKDYVIKLLKIYLFTATSISILGISESIFPSLTGTIFGFQGQTHRMVESIYFSRLAFLFWGSHLAANLIPPVFPILLLLKSEKDPIFKNNYLLTAFIIINLFAIYLSGNRASWLIITILLFITTFQYRSYLIPYLKLYVGIITIVFVAYIYSQPVEGRYISAFKALTGDIDVRYDSSGGVRLARAKTALESIQLNPLGTGWGSQGWVHNDILQIGSSVGIIPGAILIFAPILLLVKIYKAYLEVPIEQKTIFFTLFGLMVFIIVSIFLNGNFYLVQTGVPLFVLWALAQSYLDNFYLFYRKKSID